MHEKHPKRMTKPTKSFIMPWQMDTLALSVIRIGTYLQRMAYKKPCIIHAYYMVDKKAS